jgi:translation initiation factor 1 (eIF-1/SUI1)
MPPEKQQTELTVAELLKELRNGAPGSTCVSAVGLGKDSFGIIIQGPESQHLVTLLLSYVDTLHGVTEDKAA